MVTGRSGVNIERPCHSCQWGDVTFGGSPPHSVLETLRLRSGRTEFPSPGDGFRLGRSRLGGGVRLQEGWIPASAGKTDGGGWGVSAMYWQNWAACRSTLRRGSRLGGCSIRDRVSGPAPGDGFRVSGVPARRGGAPSGGMDSCLRRKDGWRGWGGGGETGAGVRSGSASRSRPLCERLPCSLHHRACSTAPCRGRTACSRADPV